jgi:hypothetical protein
MQNDSSLGLFNPGEPATWVAGVLRLGVYARLVSHKYALAFPSEGLATNRPTLRSDTAKTSKSGAVSDSEVRVSHVEVADYCSIPEEAAQFVLYPDRNVRS